MLIKVYMEERQGLEANVLVMQKRIAELNHKIMVLETAETPTVNDPEVQQPDTGKGKFVAGGATDIAKGSNAAQAEKAKKAKKQKQRKRQATSGFKGAAAQTKQKKGLVDSDKAQEDANDKIVDTESDSVVR